jgi:hypothetical protein
LYGLDELETEAPIARETRNRLWVAQRFSAAIKHPQELALAAEVTDASAAAFSGYTRQP